MNKISLTGISEQCLKENEVQHLTAVEALKYDCKSAGLLFPYHDLKGEPNCVPNDGAPLGRILKDKGEPGDEWHTIYGTSGDAYIPHNWQIYSQVISRHSKTRTLTFVVGELNALALTDAGSEYRVPAIGLRNVFGFHRAKLNSEAGFTLRPEISEVIKAFQPEQIVLAGDNYSSLDVDFAMAAVRLKTLLPDRRVAVFPWSVNEPGSFNDCRESMGDRFQHWFEDRISGAREVPAGMSPETLALGLLKSEMPFILQRCPYDRDLNGKFFGFLERTESPFRQQVFDLVDDAISRERIGGKLVYLIRKWVDTEPVSVPHDEMVEYQNAASMRLCEKAVLI